MRVLIATTDSDFAKAARLALRSDALVVDVVGTAHDTMERARAVPYDALVLDLAIPGARGVHLLKMLKHNRIAAPFLAIIADPKPEARIAALRHGAADCLVQPVLIAEFAARVHALARRAPRQAGDCVEVEDLVLHCDKRRAFRAGRALPLTKREFLALEHLVRARGEPVSTAELLDVLWHEKDAPQHNFVAVLIMRLRKKVDDDFPTKLLHTQRGAGYFVAPPGDQPTNYG